MIYLLYGEDTYRSRKKLNEIIAEYRKKAGGTFDFHRLDAEEENLRQFKSILETRSLFNRKKLIVVENIFSESANPESLAELAEKQKENKDVVVILWARGAVPQAKIKLIEKILTKNQEFKNLSGIQLNGWIAEEAKKRGLKFFPAQLAYLENFGNDLWAVANELDKIAAYAETGFEGSANLQEAKIFDLGDVFFTAKKTALHNLLRLLRQGEDEFGIFAYLTNYSRTLLAVKTYSEKKQPLPPASSIHPFVAKKAAALTRDLTLKKLERWHEKFFEEDLKIKTGQSTPRESLLNMLLL